MPRTAPRPNPPARRPISIDDLRCLVGVADPSLSPDGSRLAMVRSQVSANLRSEASIWIVATDGKGSPRALTAGPKDRLARFSPDGKRLAFVRGGEAGAQLAILDLAGGGEARTLTRFPEGSIRSFRWSPDGRTIAVAFRATEPEWTKAARDARREAGDPEPPRVITTAWHRLDGDGHFGAAEQATVRQALVEKFELDADEAARLVELATSTAKEATDLFGFTTRLNERFSDAQKLRMVELMWAVAYADGVLADHERHVLWRVADLLHVPQGAYVLARQRAAQRAGLAGQSGRESA